MGVNHAGAWRLPPEFGVGDANANYPPDFVMFQKFQGSDCLCYIYDSEQDIHRHQTPPRYHHVASASRLKVQPSTHRHTANYGQP